MFFFSPSDEPHSRAGRPPLRVPVPPELRTLIELGATPPVIVNGPGANAPATTELTGDTVERLQRILDTASALAPLELEVLAALVDEVRTIGLQFADAVAAGGPESSRLHAVRPDEWSLRMRLQRSLRPDRMPARLWTLCFAHIVSSETVWLLGEDGELYAARRKDGHYRSCQPVADHWDTISTDQLLRAYSDAQRALREWVRDCDRATRDRITAVERALATPNETPGDAPKRASSIMPF